MRTYQLRRYELEPGGLVDFANWVERKVIPVRNDFGFRVEWRLLDPENSQFIWLVSAPGQIADFQALDQRYQDSAERAAAAAEMPKVLKQVNLSFVTPF